MRSVAPILLAVLAALALAAAPASAFAGRDGRIVFGWSSFSESELEPFQVLLDETAIQTISPRGGAPTTVRGCTRAAGRADVGDCTIRYRDPSVAPAGDRVAFDAGASIALMRFEGGGLRVLPAHSADDGDPAFSPDGTHLIFSAGAGTETFDPTPDRGIWVSDLAGGNAQRLTARGTRPAWSARNWIAFVRANGVYRMRPDGHGLRRVFASRRCTDVAWSPHGTKLAFACRDFPYVADADGRHAHRVRGTRAMRLAWSPSGRRLVVNPFDGVATIRTDGTGLRELIAGTSGATYSSGAGGVDWQPLH